MTTVAFTENNPTQLIELTQTAKDHIISYLIQRNCQAVRFSVKKTGCSGLSYQIDYVHVPEEEDFRQAISEKFQLYLDKKSYPYLKGLTIDYLKQGFNYKFVFTNPNQKGQCGCGESFTVE